MQCSMCGGDLGLLGILGDLAHLRCRQCGWQESCLAEDLPQEEEEVEEEV